MCASSSSVLVVTKIECDITHGKCILEGTIT